jgi:hypothetical protein
MLALQQHARRSVSEAWFVVGVTVDAGNPCILHGGSSSKSGDGLVVCSATSLILRLTVTVWVSRTAFSAEQSAEQFREPLVV